MRTPSEAQKLYPLNHNARKGRWRPSLVCAAILLVALLSLGRQGFSARDSQAGALASLADSILVQLDWEPTFGPPLQFRCFTRTPEFTLFADGQVVLIHRIPRESESVLTIRLVSSEADSILERVFEMGFGLLESYTAQWRQRPDGTAEGLCDASYSIISARTPSGELRTVKTYGDFSNEPVVLRNIIEYLEGWGDQAATAYVPTKATLVVESKWTSVADAPQWPLAAALLGSAPGIAGGRGAHSSLSTERAPVDRAYVITGLEYERLARGGRQYYGSMSFNHSGETYLVGVRPWLRGEDFTREVVGYRFR